jgi:CHAT domain-containing protein
MVADTYGGTAQLLQAELATVDSVRDGLEGAAYAHLATHGNFRADNPLFSSLTLANGALTVYDLESLGVPPGVVVLSACDSGLSSVHPGDELMGLTGALLRIGTRSLVASVAPVPDEVAQRTMVAFHAELQSGVQPAVALHRAREGLNDEDKLRAGSFVCFGAG